MIRNLDDIVAAHMEGTVQRVRPKLMTVSTMLIGLVPLLWATSSGADVMKRIAAPMVGGLLTSAFLTLEIIPVVVTYWRLEQLLWERLAAVGPDLLRRLKIDAAIVAAGATLAARPGRRQHLPHLPRPQPRARRAPRRRSSSSAASPPTSFTDPPPASWSGRPSSA